MKHGHARRSEWSPEYYSWTSMHSRCANSNTTHWKHYGGRGVKVCDRWQSFENFLADMGTRPPGMSLDRIDNEKDYEPNNCRWADRSTQARNSKQVVWVEINGVKKRLVEWCEEYGMSVNTVRDRVKYHGWSYAEALTIPRQPKPGVSLKTWKPRRG